MAGIQATNGIVTGIDIQGTVDQLMSLAAAPRTRLTNATKQIQNEQVALTSLTALIVGVQLSTDRSDRLAFTRLLPPPAPALPR